MPDHVHATLEEEELAALTPMQTEDGEAIGAALDRLDGQRVSARFFDVLGVQPLIGPGLDPQEDRAGGIDQVVLSHRLWQRSFGGSPEVLRSRLPGRARA